MRTGTDTNFAADAFAAAKAFVIQRQAHRTAGRTSTAARNAPAGVAVKLRERQNWQQ